ncbi:hypothetical protein DIJ64_02210 [Mycobacterium leprae]|uniref:Uncharacterized protein n=1 Tax=Mycobacterium leprae TaxID=1769 RepID=A0AAD0KRI7_MYCLR|nr:hypothetical protein DIJ64_02210 [Mycobacterium leprae]
MIAKSFLYQFFLEKIWLSESSQSLVRVWAAEMSSAMQWRIFIKIAHYIVLYTLDEPSISTMVSPGRGGVPRHG